jgi:FdhD protein
MTSRSDRLPITAAVLAGGRSMRMGVDKTLLDVDGRPLVLRVIDAVAEACDEVIVVTNRPEAVAEAGVADDIPVLTDEVAYQGPLGGLATAMASARNEWVLAVAADMPHLSADVVGVLWNAREGADVVVPISERGPEPLLALYRVEACLPVARSVLETGRRRLVAMFPKLRVAEIPEEALRQVDPDLRSLVNVNTPADLAEARDVAAGSSHDGRETRITVTAAPPRAMPSERAVTLYMNDVEVATVQATPSHLEEMAVGFLLAEGLLSDREGFDHVEADAKRGLVYVTTSETVPDDMVFRTRYVTSGCGKGVTFSSLGHARALDPVTSDLRVDSAELYALVGELSKAAAAYRDTGGMHACALSHDGLICVVREDVGRHNAVDKVVGQAWLDRIPTEDGVLLSTGRISYEMAVKAAKAKVAVVVSRSAVTDLAAQIADELGITLVGYARGGRLTVYTHPERVVMEAPGV